MTEKVLPAILIVFLTLSPVFGLDLGVEHDKTKRNEREKSLTTKSNQESRNNSGNKQSKTTTNGIDQQDQEIIKQIEQRMQHSGLDISLSLGNVFRGSLAILEKFEPTLRAELLTTPKQPADFGLSAEISPGVIDSIKQEWLNKAATSNILFSSISEDKKIRDYRDNLALYGIIIGQAYLNLTRDLATLNTGVDKDGEGNIVINKIGYEDLLTLADGALLQAVSKITNKRLKRLLESIKADKRPCRFGGSISTIQCGSSTITIGGQPGLIALGLTIFSSEQFAGFTGNYKVSSGWSYNQAMEDLKSTAKYSKIAKEVSKYAEKMESHGKSREAIMAKKLTWNHAKTGKVSLSLAKLIPGIQ